MYSLRTLHTDEQGLREPARIYRQQLFVHTECRMEDLPGAMDDSDELPEIVKDIRVVDTT